MSKKNPSRDEALEAIDFIVNVLKEHEKDLDKLIGELGTITDKLGDTGEFSGKIEKVEDGYALLTMNVEEKHLQFLKTVHGGAIASLADSAAAWATVGSTGLEAVPITVEMKINFLAPVESGRLIAEARIVHKGKTISLSDVEVKDDKGRLVAKSLVTYYLRSNQ